MTNEHDNKNVYETSFIKINFKVSEHIVVDKHKD